MLLAGALAEKDKELDDARREIAELTAENLEVKIELGDARKKADDHAATLGAIRTMMNDTTTVDAPIFGPPPTAPEALSDDAATAVAAPLDFNLLDDMVALDGAGAAAGAKEPKLGDRLAICLRINPKSAFFRVLLADDRLGGRVCIFNMVGRGKRPTPKDLSDIAGEMFSFAVLTEAEKAALPMQEMSGGKLPSPALAAVNPWIESTFTAFCQAFDDGAIEAAIVSRHDSDVNSFVAEANTHAMGGPDALQAYVRGLVAAHGATPPPPPPVVAPDDDGGQKKRNVNFDSVVAFDDGSTEPLAGNDAKRAKLV